MNTKAVLMRMLVILGIVSLLFLAGCGGGSYSNPPPSPSGTNPTPAITTISPTSAAAGGAAFTLTINGTNFVAASMVNFGGAAPATTFVNSTQLTAAISAAAIASTGTLAVTVTNPAPGGGISNTMNFTITSGTNPVPRIDFLSPSGAAVGGPAFTLTVSGSNFVASSIVRWNGTDRPTAFVSSSQVTAQIPAGDIAATGTAAITAFNPAPGGGTSNSLNFSVVTGLGPVSVAVAPDPSGKFGKFAYVANSRSNNIGMYTINAATGVLTSIGTIDAGLSPSSIAIDPSGRFAYVTNGGRKDQASNVSMYAINAATGALTSTGTVAAGPDPRSVAVDPSGKFAYVANLGDFVGEGCGLSMYSINATSGVLTPTGTIDACFPVSVAVHPSGKFAYAASIGDASFNAVVLMYKIDAATGALTSIGTIAAGSFARSIAIDPSGKFAYVANEGPRPPEPGNVSMYTINAATGALASIGTVATGSRAISVAVEPSGKFAYVANCLAMSDLSDCSEGPGAAGNVSMYTTDAATGALTSIGTIAAESSPSSIAIDPSGKFAYVANFGSNTVSMYSIDAATGALTLIGTIGT